MIIYIFISLKIVDKVGWCFVGRVGWDEYFVGGLFGIRFGIGGWMILVRLVFNGNGCLPCVCSLCYVISYGNCLVFLMCRRISEYAAILFMIGCW